MAKTQTAATLSPHRFSPGQEIVAEDALAVSKHLNWLGANRPATHVSLATGAAGWGGDAEAAPWAPPIGGSKTEIASFLIYVDSDVTNLLVGAECALVAGNEVEVTYTIGGGSAVLAHADTDNGAEVTDTIAVADTGTGWQTVTIEVERTAGSSAANELRHIRVAEEPAASLPSPVLLDGA